MDKDKIVKLAKSLKFEMTDEEYLSLEEEFTHLPDELAKINKLEGIDSVEAMIFPMQDELSFRKDEEEENLSTDDVLANASSTYLNQVKVAKVVE